MASNQRRIRAISGGQSESSREIDPTLPAARGDSVADPILIVTLADLMRLVPGTGRNWWRFYGIVLLEKAGAVRRTGKRWIGRRSAIEAALLAAPASSSSDGSAG